MSDQKLTRKGARNLTELIDKVAEAVQQNPAILGIDPKIAKDFAYRCDLISDAVEATASINFPKQAVDESESEVAAEQTKDLKEDADPASDDQNKPSHFEGKAAADQEGMSVDHGESGYDANDIGESDPGPLEGDSDESYMSGHFTQEESNELGDRVDAGDLATVDKKAGRPTPEITVQGYAGFTDQIRRLSALADEADELDARIEAAVGPLVEARSALSKDMKKIHETIKADYKDSLTAIGDITVERKTKLQRAAAQLKVVERRASVNQVFAELVNAAAEEYGAEVARFIETTASALTDMNKTMAIQFKGFELEERAMGARVASEEKQAGLADLLARFQDMLGRTWKRITQVAKTALGLVQGQAARVDSAHDDLMTAMKQLDSSKLASEAPVEKQAETAAPAINLFA